MTDTLDAQFETAALWREEALALRGILAGCPLVEARKWAKPCYTHEGANICIMQRMKDHLALMFFKGALVADPEGLLKEQGPNSRSAKRLEFTSLADINDRADAIRALVAAAIEAERAGLKPDAAGEPDLPEELTEAFGEDPGFRAAFEALTPGRQRGYILHFAGAKQPATRAARIGKHRARILDGLGLHDR